ncbi:MAG: MAPEG family protein [Parvularculaceae bacterium]|nr:MAPEG family protein [Parvularculaceae bacterium]
MTPLQAAALWIGLNVLLLIFLSARVGQMRNRLKINLGDGGNPEMVKAIRAHGNYTEYAPLALVGLVALAEVGANVAIVHVLGGFFFFARIAHMLGLGLGVWPMGRFIGTLSTMLSLLATAALLIYFAAF